MRWPTLLLFAWTLPAPAASPCECPPAADVPRGLPTPLPDLLSPADLEHATGLRVLGQPGLDKIYVYGNTTSSGRARSFSGLLGVLGSVRLQAEPGDLWFDLRPCPEAGRSLISAGFQGEAATIDHGLAAAPTRADQVWKAILTHLRISDPPPFPKGVAPDQPLDAAGWNAMRAAVPAYQGTPFASLQRALRPSFFGRLGPGTIGVGFSPGYLRVAATSEPALVHLQGAELRFRSEAGVEHSSRPVAVCTPPLALGSTGITLDFDQAWVDLNRHRVHPVMQRLPPHAQFEPVRSDFQGLIGLQATMTVPLFPQTWTVSAPAVFISGTHVAGTLTAPAQQHGDQWTVDGLDGATTAQDLERELAELGLNAKAVFSTDSSTSDGRLVVFFSWQKAAKP